MHVVTTSLRVLEAVAERQPTGVSELARSLGIPRTTVQRSLEALRDAGWLRADVDGRSTRWVLTTRPLTVATQAGGRSGLRELSLPVMEELRHATGETIYLAVLEGDRMVVIERLESPKPVRTVYALGESAPAHASSTGKAVLALQSRERVASLLESLSSYTPTTVTEFDELMSELDMVRHMGYAVNRGEWRAEIYSAAAAIRDARGSPLGAISISAPVHRVSEEVLHKRGELVRDAVSRLRAHY